MLARLHRFLFTVLHRYTPIHSGIAGPPRHEIKGYQQVADYINKKDADHTQHAYWKLEEAEHILPEPVQIFGEAQPQAAVTGGYRWTTEWLYLLPNTRFYVKPFCFVTQDDYLLSPVSHFHSTYPRSNPAFRTWKLPKTRKLKGYAVVLRLGNVWYHNLTEGLPALLLLERAGISLTNIDHFIIGHSAGSMVYDWLKAWGIPSEKILLAGPRAAFLCEHLFIPTFQNRGGNWFAAPIAAKLGSRLPPPTLCWPQKIYISRQRCNTRRLHNEAELLPLLLTFGYTTVLLEDLSLAEQIALFSQATHVMGVHGSGLANIIFCKPGTVVAELRTAWHANGHQQTYLDLAGYGRVQYYLLYTNKAVSTKTDKVAGVDQDADLVVESTLLEPLLISMDKGQNKASS